ncbi:2OG-Fe dioxygenase family protein [Pseudoroseomonas globiformis]|uniref:2OG-Fe dioxygenase family protein n=1 Tax=Teichococcus globiformis TaxID=2307229 RepID=A0ABV7G594_9PROT
MHHADPADACSATPGHSEAGILRARTGDTIGGQGYAALNADAARTAFDVGGAGSLSGAAWSAFAASWDNLRPDEFMADKGRYRLRRHAVWRLEPGDPSPRRAPHQPHYQSLNNNPLNGGVQRWFAPVDDAVAKGPALDALLCGARSVFDRLVPGAVWHVEAHQFRIQARADEAGKPTPEGMHRDGVDYVMVTLIGRENVAGGVTAIRIDGQEGEAASFTLTEPLDSVLLDDRRVWHGVTPVVPLDAAREGHRDVLVLTFRRLE